MTAIVPHVAAAERMRQLPLELAAYTGFGEVLAALAAGDPASIDGAWGSACALVAAAVGAARRPMVGALLVLCPTQREADDLGADIELFSETTPLIYPAW